MNSQVPVFLQRLPVFRSSYALALPAYRFKCGLSLMSYLTVAIITLENNYCSVASYPRNSMPRDLLHDLILLFTNHTVLTQTWSVLSGLLSSTMVLTASYDRRAREFTENRCRLFPIEEYSIQIVKLGELSLQSWSDLTIYQ